MEKYIDWLWIPIKKIKENKDSVWYSFELTEYLDVTFDENKNELFKTNIYHGVLRIKKEIPLWSEIHIEIEETETDPTLLHDQNIEFLSGIKKTVAKKLQYLYKKERRNDKVGLFYNDEGYPNIL